MQIFYVCYAMFDVHTCSCAIIRKPLALWQLLRVRDGKTRGIRQDREIYRLADDLMWSSRRVAGYPDSDDDFEDGDSDDEVDEEELNAGCSVDADETAAEGAAAEAARVDGEGARRMGRLPTLGKQLSGRPERGRTQRQRTQRQRGRTQMGALGGEGSTSRRERARSKIMHSKALSFGKSRVETQDKESTADPAALRRGRSRHNAVHEQVPSTKPPSMGPLRRFISIISRSSAETTSGVEMSAPSDDHVADPEYPTVQSNPMQGAEEYEI